MPDHNLPYLQVSAVRKSYGDSEVLRGIDLEMEQGSILALLGSSGSGKTTLLRLIAGFTEPETGTIKIDGRLVAGAGSSIPPERRHIGYVPQEGALFPHLNVAKNITFGLKPGPQSKARLDEVLHITGLSGLEDRFPHQLSGGQQRRTALARALAPRPSLILLDEPFNALDLDLRRAMASEVASALRSARATAILVTHDPLEAFSSADRIAAMTHGLIAQLDAPSKLYQAPINADVARLTGTALFLDADIAQGYATTRLGRIALQSPSHSDPQQAQIMLRPEQFVLAEPGTGVPGTIFHMIFNGDHYLASVDVGGVIIPLLLREAPFPKQGSEILVTVAGSCVVMKS